LARTKPDDDHEWSKRVVLILILIFKAIHPLYHTRCVIDILTYTTGMTLFKVMLFVGVTY